MRFVCQDGSLGSVLQRLHQNDGNHRAKEEAQHEGVHNRKPVDLLVKSKDRMAGLVLEELWIQISVRSVLISL